MAKKAAAKKTPAPKPEGTERRLTHKIIMDGIEMKEGEETSYLIYGLARKAIVKDTAYGRVNGFKGKFEAVTPADERLTSKQAFLPAEMHASVVKLLNDADGEDVSFGVEVTVKDDSITAAFFSDPVLADPMAHLRQQAEQQ
jgi:hypothetical protein